jgi:maleylpyruvate isomerase
MYASPSTRAADIEAGAGRPGDVIVADTLASAQRFVVDASCMPAEAWQKEIVLTSGGPEATPMRAGEVLERRLREVEIHHVDLAAGYTFAQSPGPLVTHLLEDTLAQIATRGLRVAREDGDSGVGWTALTRDGAELDLSASEPDLLAWLTGRSPGRGIEARTGLPTVPSLG